MVHGRFTLGRDQRDIPDPDVVRSEKESAAASRKNEERAKAGGESMHDLIDARTSRKVQTNAALAKMG
jgi:hypothetical protein